VSNSECLRVRGLGASWGGVAVLGDVDLDVADGELVVLMGPNGSGKTTLLRCLVGLERPTGGSISLHGRRLDGIPTHRRGIGMLFQDPALFPHRTVWENVAYGLAIARRPRAEIDRRVEAMLALLHLQDLADRAPEALSGGERQRVALARTLAPEPPLVLLDEPFASVDVEIRRELRSEFRRALSATGTAAIHVTHDREEGLLLADRVVLLLRGHVVQSGPPEQVYGAPTSGDSARFLGYNVVAEGAQVWAIAPGDIEIGTLEGADRTGEVVLTGFVGGNYLVELSLRSGSRLECRLPPGARPPPVGTRVGVRWRRAVALSRVPD
jgi:ABC-type Fe3+/spermidine/putrescine transport system ATPase subunit